MKRVIIAGAAGIAAVAAVTASAASLGGLGSDAVGAGSDIIATCDSDGFEVVYSEVYNPDDTSYWVNQVILGTDDSGVDVLCNGQNLQMTIAGSDNTALRTFNQVANVVDDSIIVSFNDDSLPALDIYNVAVVISGQQ